MSSKKVELAGIFRQYGPAYVDPPALLDQPRAHDPVRGKLRGPSARQPVERRGRGGTLQREDGDPSLARRGEDPR